MTLNVTYASGYYGGLVEVYGYSNNPVNVGQTIAVPDDIGARLLSEPGWLAADASAAAYVPATPPILEDVYLVNNVLSKKSGTTNIAVGTVRSQGGTLVTGLVLEATVTVDSNGNPVRDTDGSIIIEDIAVKAR